MSTKGAVNPAFIYVGDTPGKGNNYITKRLIKNGTRSLFLIHCIDGLHEFIYSTSKWHKHNIINKPNKLFQCPFNTTSIDAQEGKIYFLHPQGSMAILDIKNNDTNKHEWQIVDNVTKTGPGSSGIIINNDFHIIGGQYNTNHLKYNSLRQSFDLVQLSGEQFRYQQLVKVKNKVILFPGVDHSNLKQYDINENNWEALPVQMPFSTNRFGATSIMRESVSRETRQIAI